MIAGINMNSKKRCIEAIMGNQVDRTPVFPLLMFLAAEKFGISYREFATNGSAMACSQVNMFERFDIDAITSCSDAFRITADLGADMCYPENQTPFSRSPLVRSEADLKRLKGPDAAASSSRMQDRVRGVREMVKAVGDECLVLGWVDMPFAEACSLCGVSNFMMLLMENQK